jgi:hypothetical protein
MDNHQLWGGRFEKPLDASAFQLGQSIYLDIRLLPYDIQQSMAYVNALGESSLIAKDLQQRIEETLTEIAIEFQSGILKFAPTDEDVHGFLERLLVERVGSEASLIRIGRSRNDQVVTDLKLLLFAESEKLQFQIRELIHTIVERSEELVDVFSTSYTHTQRAQPIIASHELLKHGFALSRNLTRLRDWFNRHNSLPLGSGAGTGSSVSINFEQIAQELGFQEVAFNLKKQFVKDLCEIPMNAIVLCFENQDVNKFNQNRIHEKEKIDGEIALECLSIDYGTGKGKDSSGCKNMIKELKKSNDIYQTSGLPSKILFKKGRLPYRLKKNVDLA